MGLSCTHHWPQNNEYGYTMWRWITFNPYSLNMCGIYHLNPWTKLCSTTLNLGLTMFFVVLGWFFQPIDSITSIGKKTTVVKRQMRHKTNYIYIVSRYLCSDSLPFFHLYITQHCSVEKWWGVSIFDKLSVTCHQTAHNKKGWTIIFCHSQQAPL